MLIQKPVFFSQNKQAEAPKPTPDPLLPEYGVITSSSQQWFASSKKLYFQWQQYTWTCVQQLR